MLHSFSRGGARHICGLVLNAGFSSLGESNYYHPTSYNCYTASPGVARYHLPAAVSSSSSAAAAAAAGYVDAVMDVATDMSLSGVYYAGPYPHADHRQSTGAAASGFYGSYSYEYSYPYIFNFISSSKMTAEKATNKQEAETKYKYSQIK